MKKPYKSNKSLLSCILAFLFVSGVVAGATIALFSGQTINFTGVKPDKTVVFTSSFNSFLKPCMVIWLSGFTGISACISSIALAYRGGIFGFLICTVFKAYGLGSGIFKALAISLPHNIIYFPFLLFLSLAAIRPGRKMSAEYIITLALSIFVCAISALTDAFITSEIIKFTF